MDNPHFFTLTELQEMLNRSDREALTKSIRRKQIEHTKFDREIIITTANFLAWLEANKVTPAAKSDGGQ